MKAIFNLDTDKEVTLEFDQVTESYFAPNPNVVNTLTLDFRKYNLIPTQTMAEYCAPIFGDNFIETIHVYNTNEEPSKENLSMIFNKYHYISACKTVLDGSKSTEATNNSDGNAKTGTLTLIQK